MLHTATTKVTKAKRDIKLDRIAPTDPERYKLRIATTRDQESSKIQNYDKRNQANSKTVIKVTENTLKTYNNGFTGSARGRRGEEGREIGFPIPSKMREFETTGGEAPVSEEIQPSIIKTSTTLPFLTHSKMASPPSPATMDNLPREILSNIFLRLLAKQLAQMRSVSKTWNTLLSKRSFVKSHLHRSIKNNDKLLLVSFQGFSLHSKPFTAHRSRCPRIELPDFIKLPVEPQFEDTYGKVIGSVNGLICFSSESSLYCFLHIWNPSLSSVVTLPPFYQPNHGYYPFRFFMRFGFDPRSDDYKIVKITSILGKPPGDHVLQSFLGVLKDVVKEWKQVEVYSMRKGAWQSTTQRFPSHITWIDDQDEVFVDGYDGHIHWLCYTNLKGKRQVIVAFDVGHETFSEIPLPDSILDYNMNRLNVLGHLGGKLCVMSAVVDKGCEVWVMNEHGVAESWVKYCVLSHLGNIVPFGFTSYIELCFQDQNGRLALYDAVASKVKKFQLSDKEHRAFKIVEYVDSLVWVTPSKPRISCPSISQLRIGN
ncbi:hypothetical protein LXL04_022170 [Taraxacum kok-saghyz]